MKKVFLVLCLLLIIAGSALSQVDVFTYIEASGSSFNPGDSMSLYVVPVNQSSKYLRNLDVKLSLPGDIMITNTKLPDNPDKLAPYESKIFEYTVRNINPLKTSLPVTGDKTPPMFIYIGLSIAALVAFWKIGLKRGTSLFLIICFCTQLVPEKVIAEENLIIGHNGQLVLTVDGRKETITSTATATEELDISNVDEDGDGLSALEEQMMETDDLNVDTDGDGLNDYEEVSDYFTYPTKADTNGNGVTDGHEDADSDGLDNLDEKKRGTSPFNQDTDGDGLNDGKEVITGTNPLSPDTDGDKMLDGFEVDKHLNPLVSDQTVESIDDEYTSDSSAQGRVVVRNVSGAQAQSLSIRKIPEDDLFLGNHVPGWIGNACEISMNDSSNVDATLTMTYDKSVIEAGGSPKMFYFDEGNQILTEVPGQINDPQNGSISAPLTHFSGYLTLDEKLIQYASAPVSISVPKVVIPGPTANTEYIVINDSDVRVSNSVTQLIKDVWNYLTDQFDKGRNRTGVTDSGYAKHVFNDDTGFHPYSKNAYSEVLDTSRNIWHDWYTPAVFLQNMLNSVSFTYSKKEIYFVASTKDQITVEQANTIGSDAKNKGININIIIVTKDQNYKESDLNGVRRLASVTGGSTYLVSSIYDFYGSTGGGRPSDQIDSNHDGLTDGDTWDIVNGYVKNDLFRDLFDGLSYEQVQSNADWDGDGAKNGEEIEIYHYQNGKRSIYVKSFPTVADSDFDGIPDKKDSEPMNRVHYLKWKEDAIEGDPITVQFYMDYGWFNGDNTKFNRNMAVASSVLASLAYDNGKDKTRTLEGKDIRGAAGTYLGMQDVQSRKTKNTKTEGAYAVHMGEVTLGHHEFTKNGKKHMVILAAVTGYVPGEGWKSWISNFTVGYPGEANKWPAWTDEKNHQGFDMAANLLLDEVADYITTTSGVLRGLNYVDEVDIWTMGHSRGGAVSNLLASKIVDGHLRNKLNARISLLPEIKVFAYDFATPRNTQNNNNSKYDCIFNIINVGDPVPMLPLKGWGFRRYGQNYRFSLYSDLPKDSQLNTVLRKNSKQYVRSLEEAFCALTSKSKYDVNETGVNEAVNGIFYLIADNRKDLYKTKLSLNITDNKPPIRRAYVQNFLKAESERPLQYTEPYYRPEGTKTFFKISEDGMNVYTAPEYTMVQMGYTCSTACDVNTNMAIINFGLSQSTLDYPLGAFGLMQMALNSNTLVSHVGPAYYLGAYTCTYAKNQQ